MGVVTGQPLGGRPSEAVLERVRLGRALRRPRWLDAPLLVVLVTAAVSAAVAVSLSFTVFSHLSVNDDESVYLLQARALAHGNLFPPAPHPASSFTPWLGVIRHQHFVMKYLPVLPAVLAVSLVVTGGYALALAGMALALAAATFLLAKEITGSRRTAAAAVVLMSVSPVVIVQSGLALPYLPFLALAELTWWGLLSARRTGSGRRLVLAGLCGSLAFALRPFDALLLLLPAVGWLLWRTRGRVRLIAFLFAGGVLPASGMLWYCWAATGSPFKLPFSLFSPQDTLGFGTHRMYAGETARHFGPAQGWQGLLRHLSLLGGGWAIGGILLLALAAFAVRRYRFASGLGVVVAGSLLLTFGYLFFWGVWNAAILWGGIRYLGPYYLLPLLVPGCVLAAGGLEAIAAQGRAAAAAIAVAAITISGITLDNALSADAALNADNGALAAAVEAQGRSLVFVDTYPNYLQHPSSVVSNSSPPGGTTVYAIDRGGANFAVASAFPSRGLYRLQLLGEYGRTPHKNFGARLEHLGYVTAGAITFVVHATVAGGSGSAELVVVVGDRQVVVPLSPTRPNDLRLLISADTQAATRAGSTTIAGAKPTGGSMTLAIRVPESRGGQRTTDQVTVPLMLLRPGALAAIAPDRLVNELGPLPPPRLTVALAS
jgi:4-amino-4-deoxy-L-arabinose transferase-like glycosyltransferase